MARFFDILLAGIALLMLSPLTFSVINISQGLPERIKSFIFRKGLRERKNIQLNQVCHYG